MAPVCICYLVCFGWCSEEPVKSHRNDFRDPINQVFKHSYGSTAPVLMGCQHARLFTSRKLPWTRRERKCLARKLLEHPQTGCYQSMSTITVGVDLLGKWWFWIPKYREKDKRLNNSWRVERQGDFLTGDASRDRLWLKQQNQSTRWWRILVDYWSWTSLWNPLSMSTLNSSLNHQFFSWEIEGCTMYLQ